MAVSIGQSPDIVSCSDCELYFNPSERDHRHCQTCSEGFDAYESPRDNHCTHKCFYADKGENALNRLRTDHKLCSSCFRYVKAVHCPDKDFLKEASSLEGRAIKKGATYTDAPDGSLLLDITPVYTNTRPPGLRKDGIQSEFCYIGRQYPTEHTRYLYGTSGPWICECGNVDLQHHNEVLARQDYESVVGALARRLKEFYDKGALSHEPDLSVFFEYVEERDADLATSVGAALYRE